MKNLMNNKYYSVVLLTLILNLSLSAHSKKYFVAQNGNDSNSGLALSSSLQTISQAFSFASAGDTILVLSGSYKTLIEVKDKNGLPEKPIYLLGESSNPDSYPIIDGGASEPGVDLKFNWINLQNSSWIEISRFKFQNGWTFPINVKNSSYISFTNCRFFGGKRVINVNGASAHHILVENCFWDQGGEFLWKVVSDNKGVDAWTSMHHGDMQYYNGSLIDFNGSGGSIVIRNNTIINAFNAIRYRGTKGFDSNVEIYNNNVSFVRDNDFEPEYYTYNLHIYHNFSHNIHRTLSVDNVEGGNIYYYGNVITTDQDDWTEKICQSIWKIYGKERLRTYPLYAFNNSFFVVSKAFRTEQLLTNFKHYNNAYYFICDSSWVLNSWNNSDEFDYDISNNPWPKNIIDNKEESHGVLGDVKYVNPLKNNFRLQKSSPAIDNGKVISLTDFDWQQNFDGKAPDIGAYENDKLVEGPPFRFIKEDGSKIDYKERARIVRDYIKDNQLEIYFSAQIDPSSVKKETVLLFSDNNKIEVESISFLHNNYCLIIKTKSTLPENTSLSFLNMPIGINGELATYWASTMNIHK